jgi:hypothetical protein
LLVGGTSTTAKFAVANNTSDGTSNTRQYGVFGTATTYLNSDASNIWGSGLGELQVQNGAVNRPAMLSLGGSLNTTEGLGVINFFRSGNTNGYRSRAQIASSVTSTGTANQHGGDLRFYTAADGATNPTERARITSGGVFLIGQTSLSAASAGGKFQAATDLLSTGSGAGYFWENRSGGVTSTSNWYGWYTSAGTIFLYNGSANIASINSSSGVYTALSDVTKKKDFEDSSIGLSAVMQLKPKLFRMLDDADDTPKQLGFVAQDVKDVIPQAYVEQSVLDAGDNNATYIGLNDRPIIAALTKAIQEQQALIQSLKARLDAANL